MGLYVDTSAILKRYIDEPESDKCNQYLEADPVWATARHTQVEVRRNLARLLTGPNLETARAQFAVDWQRMNIIELDEATCEIAAEVAETTGARTLDGLHIAAARRIGSNGLTFVTFDIRQAQAARALGFTVVGA